MLLMGSIFVVGYMAIVFEHSLKLNKAGAALLTGTTLWALLNLYPGYETGILNHHLTESMAEIAGIVFFILSAMVIVEIIDTHHGFTVIFDLIKPQTTRGFVWIAGWGAFFLSAILDNLTTTIVMISMLRKTNLDVRQKMCAASIFIIAANAGGVWSPIGDITTTMLWVNEKITTGAIVVRLFFPSVLSFLVPLLIVTFMYFKKQEPFSIEKKEGDVGGYPKLIFVLGICLLASVPVFKMLIHIPPYLAMMLSLGIFWIIIEIFFRKHSSAVSDINSILKKIDYSTIFFFIGILLAVSALNEIGIFSEMSRIISRSNLGIPAVTAILGVLSAIVDNIPLLAAAMKMFPVESYPKDHHVWTYLAFCTGYGGNLLIIGSAAGVAAMSFINISFIWFLRRFTIIAAIGFMAGMAVLLLLNSVS